MNPAHEPTQDELAASLGAATETLNAAHSMNSVIRCYDDPALKGAFFLIDAADNEGQPLKVYLSRRDPHDIGPADLRWIERQLQKGVTNGRCTSWDDDTRVLDRHAEAAPEQKDTGKVPQLPSPSSPLPASPPVQTSIY